MLGTLARGLQLALLAAPCGAAAVIGKDGGSLAPNVNETQAAHGGAVLKLSDDDKPLLIQLSAPIQATTLLSDSVLDLEGFKFEHELSNGCEKVQEWFNPVCQPSPLREQLLKCFGGVGGLNECDGCQTPIWRDCSEGDFDGILSTFEATGNTFAKDNFGGALTVHKFAAKRPKYEMYVTFMPPRYTFPLRGESSEKQEVYYRWYTMQLESFVSAPKEALSAYPDLAKLQGHIADKYPLASTSVEVQACLAHYVRFYHLVTSAMELGISILRTDQLLKLSGDDLKSYLSDRPIRGVDPSEFAAALERHREQPDHLHAPLETEGQAKSVSDQLLAEHEKLWAEGSCADPLDELRGWCESNKLTRCEEFNDVYYYEEPYYRGSYHPKRDHLLAKADRKSVV